MSRVTAVFATLLLFVSVVPQCSAQGLFLEKGQSGFMAYGSYWSNENWSGVNGNLGYSVGGVFDLRGHIGRSTSDGEPEYSFSGFSGGAAWHILKPSKELRFGLSAGANFGRGSYSSDVLDWLVWDMTETSSRISVMAFGTVAGSPTFEIRPGVGFAFVHITTEIEDSFGGSVEDEDDLMPFSFGAPMAFGSADRTRLRVTPWVELSEGTTTFSLAVGVLVPN